MNTISNERVKQILREDYIYLNTVFPHDKILGLFTYGKINYGFAEKESDIQIKMYYLPSLEEMCTNLTLKDEVIKHNGHTINIKDIRLILDNILNQEGTAMECFFSKNYIITPKFQKVFEENIIGKREEIFHCNPKLRVKDSTEKALIAIAKYQDSGNTDYLFEACRRRLATELYLQGALIEDCLYLKKDYHLSYLWNIKNGNAIVNIKEVKYDLEKMRAKAELLEAHCEQEELVKSCIVEIMKIALTRTIDEKEFLGMLTDMEKSALKVIMQCLIDGEGSVSITQLTTQHNISRPVFKSVLQKLKDMEIAEINNMGVKGTHIKIIDGVFLNIDDYID